MRFYILGEQIFCCVHYCTNMEDETVLVVVVVLTVALVIPACKCCAYLARQRILKGKFQLN